MSKFEQIWSGIDAIKTPIIRAQFCTTIQNKLRGERNLENAKIRQLLACKKTQAIME